MGKNLKILAVNPGTRYLGIAVFYEDRLMEWGVKVLKGISTEGRVKRILSRTIERYEPNVLAIKKLHPSRCSFGLKNIVRVIRGWAKRKGMDVYQYPIGEIKTFFPLPQRANKKNLAETVASMHPELFYELEKEKRNKNPYHIRMFEAVALGVACYKELTKGK